MPSEPAIPDDLLDLIRTTITSIWALELLLLLKKHADVGWTTNQLVRELRGSHLLVTDLIRLLRRAALVQEDQPDQFRYRPGSPQLAELVERLERLAVERPVALRDAILAAPHDRVQGFADAFRVKKDQP